VTVENVRANIGALQDRDLLYANNPRVNPQYHWPGLDSSSTLAVLSC